MVATMLQLLFSIERQTTRLALLGAVVMLVISVTLGFYQVLTRFVFDAPLFINTCIFQISEMTLQLVSGLLLLQISTEAVVYFLKISENFLTFVYFLETFGTF